MLASQLGLLCVCLLASLLASTTSAVEILNPGEVVYNDSRVDGVVGRAVILECGSTLPDVYIWGFTQPGTGAIRALVYNFGKGPKLQKLAKSLGGLTVISNSASLSIEKLPLAAQGLYTCQALYDTEQGAMFYYYYIQLTVRVPVTKPYIVVSDSSPAEGSSVWLRCGLENGTGPIHYVWEHEIRSGLVRTVAQGNSSVVNMTDIDRNHTGWYRCVASNKVNRQRSDRIWLDVIFGPDTPQIDVTPYSVTERGYSALERETVSLLCQAKSNPPSQYVWFYNNSQVYAGPQYTITKILRMHTGTYACLAQNTYLNTRSKKTISLTVYYPPDGSPSCGVEAALNHSSLRLHCSWPGGQPAPSLHWTFGLMGLGQALGHKENERANNATWLLPGAQTSNNSLLTCLGSHPVLNHSTYCSIRTWSPPAEPVCFAYATRNKQYLMLSCSWGGGAPKALLWWEGPDRQGQSMEENSNILVIRYGSAHSGQAYTCHAKHPLEAQIKTCRLTLEAPVLVTQRSLVSVYEGSDVQLTCILMANYPPANQITWFNNRRQKVWDSPRKYLLQRAAAWTNLTVRETDGTLDSGQYWCSTSNAVGGVEIPVTLVVKRYPLPPNVTLVTVRYSSRQRSEVEVEWETERSGENRGVTGFILEHRLVQPPGRRSREEREEERGEREEGEREEEARGEREQEEREESEEEREESEERGENEEERGEREEEREERAGKEEMVGREEREDKNKEGEREQTEERGEKKEVKEERTGREESKEMEEKSSLSAWQQVVLQGAAVRSHTLGSLTPTATYQVRITAVNHRTIGHPSDAQSPADPPFNAYPVVIGATIGGMIISAMLTMLLLIFIIRNRHNNRRLHDLLFGMQHSQSRENINFPEDELVAEGERGVEEIVASPSQGPSMPSPRAASPRAASPIAGQAPPPGEDNEPVNVTITVMATGS